MKIWTRIREGGYWRFADPIITGPIGQRPAERNTLTVHPLLPSDQWAYFALQGVPYHQHLLTIFYDRDGTHYHRGKGLQVFCDEKLISHMAGMQEAVGSLDHCGR